MTEKYILGARAVLGNERLEVNTSSHPLQGLWLTKKCLAGKELAPFESIMDMPYEEATMLFVATGRRFVGNYIDERRRVDAWLKKESENIGLQPETDHPLYFQLYPQPITEGKEGRLTINFPAEKIPPEKMTFTLYDSFDNFAELNNPSPPPKEFVPKVLSANEVQLLLSKGFPETFSGNNLNHYIECQVWTRALPIFDFTMAFLNGLKTGAQSGDIVTMPRSIVHS
jgi:hypothetical protein